MIGMSAASGAAAATAAPAAARTMRRCTVRIAAGASRPPCRYSYRHSSKKRRRGRRRGNRGYPLGRPLGLVALQILSGPLLAEDRVYVDLGAEAVEQRLPAKDAAVPIDIHRMGADVPLADDAGKPVHTPLEVGLVSEIECARLADRLHDPIERFLHHADIVFHVGIVRGNAAGALHNFADHRRILVRHLLGQPYEVALFGAIVLHAAEVDQAKAAEKMAYED